MFKSIVWIKLKLELLHDFRFTDSLNDRQKLLYVGLLLLAGSTNNKIPSNPCFIKRLLNLESNPEQIKQDLDTIFKVYVKCISSDVLISFKNFAELHNQTTKGYPKDILGLSEGYGKDMTDKIREDKNKIRVVPNDSDFIGSLKSNPAYKHIDIDRELGKMDAWLSIHEGRQKTKRFVLNWLNKIEKPMEIGPHKLKGVAGYKL